MSQPRTCKTHGRPLIIGAPTDLFGDYCDRCCKKYPYVLPIDIEGVGNKGETILQPEMTIVHSGTPQARFIPIPFSFTEAYRQKEARSQMSRSVVAGAMAAE